LQLLSRFFRGILDCRVNVMNYDKLLNVATELGCQLMAGGAEIYRVEESVFRLLSSYGLEGIEVFAIPNCLIVSITTPLEHPVTRMRRISGHGTDIELLERCNDLCRRLCQETPPPEVAQAQLAALLPQYRRYSRQKALAGYFLVPACFTPLYGGGIRDGICAGLAGFALGLCLLYGQKLIGGNRFFRTAICSAIGSLLALLLVQVGLGQNLDTITISVLMLLVPGMALTNAMREIMAGDVISSISRTAEAILTGTAIALGTVIALAIGQGL